MALYDKVSPKHTCLRKALYTMSPAARKVNFFASFSGVLSSVPVAPAPLSKSQQMTAASSTEEMRVNQTTIWKGLIRDSH